MPLSYRINSQRKEEADKLKQILDLIPSIKLDAIHDYILDFDFYIYLNSGFHIKEEARSAKSRFQIFIHEDDSIKSPNHLDIASYRCIRANVDETTLKDDIIEVMKDLLSSHQKQLDLIHYAHELELQLRSSKFNVKEYGFKGILSCLANSNKNYMRPSSKYWFTSPNKELNQTIKEWNYPSKEESIHIQVDKYDKDKVEEVEGNPHTWYIWLSEDVQNTIVDFNRETHETQVCVYYKKNEDVQQLALAIGDGIDLLNYHQQISTPVLNKSGLVAADIITEISKLNTTLGIDQHIQLLSNLQ